MSLNWPKASFATTVVFLLNTRLHKQISLKIQRLIHDLRKPRSYCLKITVLNLLLDMRTLIRTLMRTQISLVNHYKALVNL